MAKSIIGKKLRMTRFFTEDGQSVGATLIEAGPCAVVSVKDNGKDGKVVQLGFEDVQEKRVNKARLGTFKKAGLSPKRYLKEVTFPSDTEIKAGDTINLSDVLAEGDIVSVRGRTKGKGFQGVIKRHGFAMREKTHGQGDTLRHGGSIGQSATPARVWKGMKMSGLMGFDWKTISGLKILKVYPEDNIIMVKGAVPGTDKNYLIINKA